MQSLNAICEQTVHGSVNPMSPLFAELWPFIDKLLTEFVTVDEICESTWRLVKHSQRVMGLQFEVYLHDFIKKTMLCY
jgi:hypothetical protein